MNLRSSLSRISETNLRTSGAKSRIWPAMKFDDSRLTWAARHCARTIFRQRLLYENRSSFAENLFCQIHMRIGLRRDDKRFGIRLFKSLFDISPRSQFRKIAPQRFNGPRTRFNHPRQFRFGQPLQRARMELSKLPDPDNDNSDWLEAAHVAIPHQDE